jgi:hypothetical protein
MSGLPEFCRVPEVSCLPAWCIARTLFASMQQCRIVSMGDLVKARIDELETNRAYLQSYIGAG